MVFYRRNPVVTTQTNAAIMEHVLYTRIVDFIRKKPMPCRIFPSLIGANLINLERDIQRLDSHCDGYHLDIMDNHFVPNLTFGVDVVHAISKATSRQLWIHLMVDNCDSWIARLNLPAGSILSFHPESTKDIAHTINRIKEKKLMASIAIKPKMAAEDIFEFLHLIDQVLVMSVEPGFSGQRFLESVTAKLTSLVQYRQTHELSFSIGMDGGIGADNIGMLAQQGVSDFAIASAIFSQPDPIAALQALKRLTA